MTDCEWCGREAAPQQCPGDRAWHHHGMVHTRYGGLTAVCDECILHVRAEWGYNRPAMDKRDPREVGA